MQEHALGVGEELVFEGGTRLTILAVEAGEVLLGVTAPNPATWEARTPATPYLPAPRGAASLFLRSSPSFEQPPKKVGPG